VEKKILPIPETMQGISTSAEPKEERSKKKKKQLSGSMGMGFEKLITLTEL
jgi:hypothetical protein